MRKQYSKKDIREFLQEHEYANPFLDKKSKVIEEDDRISINDMVCFRKYEGGWIPSLELLKSYAVLPKVVVDKGTPPFILKGADLMRPGIVSCEDFLQDDIVAIVDEQHSFPLATGKAMLSSSEIMERKEGKVVKVIHNLQTI